MADFTLPELGENIAAGDVLRVLVNTGDTLTKDQPVLELETDKATIEVPSSVAGKITAINVKPGDKVKVGQTILTVEDGTAAAGPAAPPQVKTEPAAVAAPAAASPPSKPPEVERPVQGREQDRDKVVDFARAARPAAEQPASGEPAAPAAP